jgi:hypothetical protein
MKMKQFLMTTIAIFGLAIILNAQVPSNVPSNGLVGWWPFNGNANDESGNGYHGTVNGATLTIDRFGLTNSAYTFNGLNNYITLGQNPLSVVDQLDGLDFTISLWFNNNIGGSTYLMNFGWGMYLGSSIEMIPAFGHVGIWPNNQWFTVSSNQPVMLQNWHHLVAVKSGNNQIIYINGQLLNTQNSDPAGLGAQIYAGGNPIDNNGWLNGLLDDIGFWNRALTQQEITSLYLGSSVVVNEVSQSKLFSVFPNPAQSEINVNLDPKLVGSLFTIYDNTGKAVKTGKINSENTTIEISDLSVGIYTFSVGENKKQTFKVIKE